MRSLSDVKIFVRLHVVTAISIVKTIDKYLINNGAFRPIRGLKRWCNGKVIIIFYTAAHTNAVEITYHMSTMYFEVVFYSAVSKFYRIFVIVKHFVIGYFLHRVALLVKY